MLFWVLFNGETLNCDAFYAVGVYDISGRRRIVMLTGCHFSLDIFNYFPFSHLLQEAEACINSRSSE